MKNVCTAVLAAATTILLAASVQAAPKPSEVQVAWQLDFEFQQPQAIRVLVPGEAAPRTFWYMRYTVINRTGEDRIFVPDFTLFTDTGQLLRAGYKVPTAVFATIKKTYNDPLLQDDTAITGKLLQGEDNARSGVAIWPDFDAKAGSFDIFVGGLSGENATIQLPAPVTVTEIDVRGRKVTTTKTRAVVSKTMQLNYSIPTEASGRLSTPVRLVKQDWVMR